MYYIIDYRVNTVVPGSLDMSPTTKTGELSVVDWLLVYLTEVSWLEHLKDQLANCADPAPDFDLHLPQKSNIAHRDHKSLSLF